MPVITGTRIGAFADFYILWLLRHREPWVERKGSKIEVRNWERQTGHLSLENSSESWRPPWTTTPLAMGQTQGLVWTTNICSTSRETATKGRVRGPRPHSTQLGRETDRRHRISSRWFSNFYLHFCVSISWLLCFSLYLVRRSFMIVLHVSAPTIHIFILLFLLCLTHLTSELSLSLTL